MDRNEVFFIIREAIREANINHPNVGDGTQWDQLHRSTEESEHLTVAAMKALDDAGYTIEKKSKV